MQYQFITDLPKDYDNLSGELDALSSIWETQAKKLQESESLRQFNEELKRQWAIETGIIENLYTLDRGTTELLIKKGIEASLITHNETDKSPDYVFSLIKDQENTLEGIFTSVKKKRNLTTSYIKELHQEITRHQVTVSAIDQSGHKAEVPLIKGDFKKMSNNPSRQNGTIHEYCPPEHVNGEMDNLINWHQQHVKNNVPPEIEAAWLHHRFTQIHPFQDGNGRIARTLASIVLIQAHCFPLGIDRNLRSEYIAALEAADQNNLDSFISLIIKQQKKEFLRALSISVNVIQSKTKKDRVGQIVESAIDRLESRQQALLTSQKEVFKISEVLEKTTFDYLTKIRDPIDSKLNDIHKSYGAHVDRNSDKNDYWFGREIVTVAKKIGYYADTRSYRTWIRLKIKEYRQTEIVFSFHSLGREFLGVMAVSPFIHFREKNDDTETIELSGEHHLSDEIFQFSYKDKEDAVKEKLLKWLEEIMIMAIEEWRQSL